LDSENKLRRKGKGTYAETHKWIDFKLNMDRLPFTLWRLLGEAESKCAHIAGVPLPPVAAQELYSVYLAKGVHATTSIEGNTLSEEQVRKQADKELRLPKSQQYLATEVQNILDACNQITTEIVEDPSLGITTERICQFNRLALRNLEHDEDVEPGSIRCHSVGVGTYRGAPADDCEDLLDQLCEWMQAGFRTDAPELRFAMAIFQAILSHLYIAWIHPFGDGNGRTARLIEFQILAQSGMVPLPAAHLLSNHYNKTRSKYYQVLDRSSKEPNGAGVLKFLEYAVEGFVDGLKEQLDRIRRVQWRVTWVNFVHDQFRECDTATCVRQRHLVLDMPVEENLRGVARKDLMTISPRVAQHYANKSDKTLTRDLNQLQKMGLIRRVGGRYYANHNVIQAFLPPLVGPQKT